MNKTLRRSSFYTIVLFVVLCHSTKSQSFFEGKLLDSFNESQIWLSNETNTASRNDFVPQVDSTLLISNEDIGCGSVWSPGGEDFSDVRAWAPYDLDPSRHDSYFYDERFKPSFCSLDSNFSGRDIGLKYAFENGYYGSSEMIVAIIDSGLGQAFNKSSSKGGDTTIYRADLNEAYWINEDEIYGNGLDDDGNGFVDDKYGFDFYYNTGDTLKLRSPENDQHGVGMGRIVAGKINDTTYYDYQDNLVDYPSPNINALGVCPNCKLMDLKVFGSGNEKNLSNNDFATAIRYAVDNGAKLIVMSLGSGSVPLPELTLEDGNYLVERANDYLELYVQPGLYDAIDYAWSNGVLIVGAAGNKDLGFKYTLEKAHYNTATNHPAVIQVGALLMGLLSQFNDISNDGQSIDIVVPGWLEHSGSLIAGTSEATALAAGMIANYWSENIELSNYEIKKHVLESARDKVFDFNTDSIYYNEKDASIQRVLNVTRSENSYLRLMDDPKGWDPYYGYGMLHFEDLFNEIKHRSVEINQTTGSVNGYQAPVRAYLEDFSQQFQDWHNSLPKGPDGLVLDVKSKSNEIVIYPNPVTSGSFVIEGLHQSFDFKIYNNQGRLVQTGTTEFEVDINNLNSGLYNIIISTSNQTSLWKRKLVKL